MASCRMSKKHEDVMREFIELYKENPCLWKIKSKDYSNKTLKDEAYKVLVEKLKQINEDATKQDVIKKINSMRSCFRKEFKKCIDSKKSGAGSDEVYKPALWYYKLLLFLKDQEIPREAAGFDIPNTLEEISQSHSSEDDDVGGYANVEQVEEESEIQESIPLTPQSTNSRATSADSSRSFTTKRRKNANRTESKSESLLALVNDKLSSTRREDEFDIIGKNVAEKLRNLPPQMKVFAEKVINDCLFEAQIGTLNRYSFITSPESQRSIQTHYRSSSDPTNLNTDIHNPQEQRSNQFNDSQNLSQLPPLLYGYPSPTIAPHPQNSPNMEMERDNVGKYFSNFQ